MPEEEEEVVWSTTTNFGRAKAIGGADEVPLPPLPKELDMGQETWGKQDRQSSSASSDPKLEEVPIQDAPKVLEIANPVTEITDDDNGAAMIVWRPTLPVAVPSSYCGGSIQSSKKVRAVSIVSVNGMTSNLAQSDEVDQAPEPSLTEVTITTPTLADELPVRESAELDHPGQSTSTLTTDGSPVRVSAGSDHPGRQEDRDEGSEPSEAALPDITTTTTNTTAEAPACVSAGFDHLGRQVFEESWDEELDHLVAAFAKTTITCDYGSITSATLTTTTEPVPEVAPAIVQYSLGPGIEAAQQQSQEDVQPLVPQLSAGMEYEMEDSEIGTSESQMEIDLPDLGSNAQWSQEAVNENWAMQGRMYQEMYKRDAAMGSDSPLPSTGLDLPDSEMEDAIAAPVEENFDSEMVEVERVDSDLFWEEQRAIVNAIEFPEVEDELKEEKQVTSVPEAQPSPLANIIAISQAAPSPPAQVSLPAPVATAQLSAFDFRLGPQLPLPAVVPTHVDPQSFSAQFVASVVRPPTPQPQPTIFSALAPASAPVSTTVPAPAPSPAQASTPAPALASPALAQQPAIAEQLPDIPSDDDLGSDFDWDEYDAERAFEAMDATARAAELARLDAASEAEAQPAAFPAYHTPTLRPDAPSASSSAPAQATEDDKKEREAELLRRFALAGIPLDDDEDMEEEAKPKAPLFSSPSKLRLREGDGDEEDNEYLDDDPELWGSGDEEW